jgi:hypothetical protein
MHVMELKKVCGTVICFFLKLLMLKTRPFNVVSQNVAVDMNVFTTLNKGFL